MNTHQTTTLTPEQEQYITDNRLQRSVINIAADLNLTYYHVMKFMRAKNITLSKEEIKLMKQNQNKAAQLQVRFTPQGEKRRDFWNIGVNPITFFGTTNTYK